MYIFDFVRQRRMSLSLTQIELAKRANVSLSVVKRIEADRPYNPIVSNVIKIAHALQVKTNELANCKWPE